MTSSPQSPGTERAVLAPYLPRCLLLHQHRICLQRRRPSRGFAPGGDPERWNGPSPPVSSGFGGRVTGVPGVARGGDGRCTVHSPLSVAAAPYTHHNASKLFTVPYQVENGSLDNSHRPSSAAHFELIHPKNLLFAR